MEVSKYSVIYYFLRQYRLLYGVIFVFAVAVSVLESLSVAAFFPLFSSALETTDQEASGILGAINRMADVLPFSDPIVAASVFLLLTFVAKTVLTLCKDGLIAFSNAKVLYNAKNQIIERYSSAKYPFFLDSKQGNLLYNSQIAPHRLSLLLLRVALFFSHLLRIVAITVVLALVSPLAMLAIAALGGAYLMVIYFISNRVSYSLGKGRADSYSEQTVIANEYFSGIRHIIAYRSAKNWLDKLREHNRIYSELHGKDLAWQAAPRSVIELLAVAMMVGLLLVLWGTSSGAFSSALPKLGLFAVALVQLFPSVTGIGRLRMEVMSGLADTELVYHALTGPIPILEDGTKTLGQMEEAIAFEDVSFAYAGRDVLLKDANFKFKKGEVTAIVGPSGAGKTTIINLVLGFFEPTEGRITVDGEPLTEFSLASRLGRMGLVSQEPFLYNATVAENISFGRNGHSIDEIIASAKIANAHGFISELPQGYETTVGESGMKLSGGQQQRIAIARAVLDQPEILIFDEATSSLDSVSEKLVQESIEAVSKDRTVIIIAHRLSTVRYADNIIVLDRGEVVEEGTHQALLERRGHYSQLVASAG